jgi:hypothetical protein
LTVYTRDSELQVITAPPLISIIHNSQITTAHAKPFPACCVFTVGSLQLHALKSSLNCGSLITASFPHRLLYRTAFVAPIFFFVTPWHGPSRKHLFQKYLYCCMRIRCCGNVFTEPLPRNGFGILLISRSLRHNGFTLCNT